REHVVGRGPFGTQRGALSISTFGRTFAANEGHVFGLPPDCSIIDSTLSIYSLNSSASLTSPRRAASFMKASQSRFIRWRLANNSSRGGIHLQSPLCATLRRTVF